MFNRYPYTDAHQLNLDWIIKQVKNIPTRISQLINDAGFVDSAQAAAAAPVQSVNGQTGNVIVSGTGAVDSVNGQIGNVVLTAADVGALPSSYSAPVDSVNSQTGAVVLTAADVGALPSSTTIPQKANTVPADLGATAAIGSSDRFATANHVHKMPSAADVGALESTAINTSSETSLAPYNVHANVTVRSAVYIRSGNVVQIRIILNITNEVPNGDVIFDSDAFIPKFSSNNYLGRSAQTAGLYTIGCNATSTGFEITSSGSFPTGDWTFFTFDCLI